MYSVTHDCIFVLVQCAAYTLQKLLQYCELMSSLAVLGSDMIYYALSGSGGTVVVYTQYQYLGPFICVADVPSEEHSACWQ